MMAMIIVMVDSMVIASTSESPGRWLGSDGSLKDVAEHDYSVLKYGQINLHS
jgi:hypothetical protein